MKKIFLFEDDIQDFNRILQVLKSNFTEALVFPANDIEFEKLRVNINNLFCPKALIKEEAEQYINSLEINGYDGIILDYELNETFDGINGITLYKRLGLNIKALILTKYIGDEFEKIKEEISKDSLSNQIIAEQKGNIQSLSKSQEQTYIRHINSHIYDLRDDSMGDSSPLKDVLIVVATDIEVTTVIERIFNNGEPAVIPIDKTVLFDLGTIKNCNLKLLKLVDMGSKKVSGSTLSIYDAIKAFHFDYVIMLGIAYGLKKKNQQIGNILISRELEDFDSAKFTEKQVIHRGHRIPAGTTLLSRFDALRTLGSYKDTNIELGLFISGEILSDNEEFVKYLQAEYPDAIGAEMEGTGLQSSCHREGVEWILIKGICDWGYEKQAEDKEANQKIAISNVCDFVKMTFEKLGL